MGVRCPAQERLFVYRGGDENVGGGSLLGDVVSLWCHIKIILGRHL